MSTADSAQILPPPVPLPRERRKRRVQALVEKKPDNDREQEVRQHLFGLIELAVQESVEAGFREMRTAIPGVRVEHNGMLVSWGEGELLPGCRCCLFSKAGFQAVRAATECNLSCPFCYYFGKPRPFLSRKQYVVYDNVLDLGELKELIDRRRESVEGIAWVYFEPFTDLEKHLPPIRHIASRGLHQWLYTNGLLATEDGLRALADAGLTEIRFNLAACRCDDNVLRLMKFARKLFPHLAVESPMYPEFWTLLRDKRRQVLDTGVTHIHCAELHLNQRNMILWVADKLYRYSRSYVSPISSRQCTYELMALAAEEKWSGVYIHDCSNGVKFFRGMRRDATTLYFKISREIDLGPKWYIRAVEETDNAHWDEVDAFLDSLAEEGETAHAIS